MYICVKKFIDYRGLCVDADFEVIVKGRNPKFTWKIIGIYRAPNGDIRVMEIFAARTGCTGNYTKRSINVVI